MKKRIKFLAALLTIMLVASFFFTAQPIAAESNPATSVTAPALQQGGPTQNNWDAFWVAFKAWFEQLALVFAEMPVVGPVLAAVLNFIGATNVWFCGAVIFIIFILGIARR